MFRHWQKSTSDVSALRPEPPPSSALHLSSATHPTNRLPSFAALSLVLHSPSRSAATRAGPLVRTRFTAARLTFLFASLSSPRLFSLRSDFPLFFSSFFFSCL